MKEQTSFKTFFLNNQAVGTAECPQGDFEAKDGVIVGAAQCSYGAQNFTIYIRVSGDMVTTYTAQSAMTRGGAPVDVSKQPAVVSTRIGDC